MTLKKRFLAVCCAGMMAMSLAGCGGSGSSSDGSSTSSGSAAATNSSDGDYSISVVLKTEASEHWQLIKAGCEQFEKDNPGVTVDIKGPPSETSYDEQMNMIDTDLNAGYDAYVIAPLQSDSVSAQIASTDKPVIALDTNIDSDKVVAFVGTGNKEAAKLGATEAVQAAKDAGWETIEAIEICGVQGDATNTARYEGYKEGFEEAGATFLADETQYADAVADKAVNSMEAIMQTHPEGIAIVCANNDDMACAAAKAAADNSAYANTIFLGFDGSTSACQAVIDGSLTLTCAQQPYDMGYKACETALAAAKGEDVSDVDTGTEIVNADNAQARIDKMNDYLATVE